MKTLIDLRFGSQNDDSFTHREITQQVAEHVNRNCVGLRNKPTARRQEMIAILQGVVDKLILEDSLTIAARPTFDAL